VETFQIGSHVGRSLVAQVGVFLQQFVDHALEPGWGGGIQLSHGCGTRVQDGIEDGSRCGSGERLFSGSHFVEHDAEGEQVSAGIERLAERLFGRHVGDGAHGGAGLRELKFEVRGVGRCGIARSGVGRSCVEHAGGGAGTFGNFRESKVENLGVTALGHEDVRGFDVAVNDAAGVGGVESVHDFNGQRKQLLAR